MAPTVAPPDPPELPEGAERRPPWPALFALWGFLVGLGTTLVAGTMLAAVVVAVGGEADGTAVTVIGTVAQGFCFAGTAWFFASRVAKPRLWHFGLQGSRFWSTRRLGRARHRSSFYVITVIYGALVQPDAEQETVEALGGDQGTFGLIVAGHDGHRRRARRRGVLLPRLLLPRAARPHVDRRGGARGRRRVRDHPLPVRRGRRAADPAAAGAARGPVLPGLREDRLAAGADRDARVQQRGRVRRPGRRRLDGLGGGGPAGVRRAGGGGAPAPAGPGPVRPRPPVQFLAA